MTRQEMDALAWSVIDAKKPIPMDPRPSMRLGHRPRNYRELEQQIDSGREFEIAWGDFLHEFYIYKRASFFSEVPPFNISHEWRVILAGAAEYLSDRCGLVWPAWIQEPGFFLAEEWDVLSERLGDVLEYRDERVARCEHAWLHRNVIFEARNLITL